MLAILIATFGCANGMILAGARVYYAMASDGLFFRKVARISPRRQTPVFSLIIQAVWTSVLVLSGTYSELLDYVIFAALLFYVLTVCGLFVLRKKRPDLERPYKTFGYPVLPAIYVLLASLVMLDLLWVKPKFTWPGLVIVLTGVPVYFFWNGGRKTPKAMACWKAKHDGGRILMMLAVCGSILEFVIDSWGWKSLRPGFSRFGVGPCARSVRLSGPPSPSWAASCPEAAGFSITACTGGRKTTCG